MTQQNVPNTQNVKCCTRNVNHCTHKKIRFPNYIDSMTELNHQMLYCLHDHCCQVTEVKRYGIAMPFMNESSVNLFANMKVLMKFHYSIASSGAEGMYYLVYRGMGDIDTYALIYQCFLHYSTFPLVTSLTIILFVSICFKSLP